MGFLLQDKILFPKETRYVALYIGLTTGFCGSLTSFSSFMWNSFQALANLDPYFERNRGYNVLALCGQVIITLCGSIAGLRFGAHIAQMTGKLLPSLELLGGERRRGLDLLGVGLGVGGWTAAGIMCGFIPKWRGELFTAVLAPAGTHPSICLKSTSFQLKSPVRP
jgi:fluoride exporter